LAKADEDKKERRQNKKQKSTLRKVGLEPATSPTLSLWVTESLAVAASNHAT
jgi:hypothetical protein